MTVSTVVAGLLPIMWSTSVGAEVMKPLATPVLGGMISSLIHVLIVTPVIFFSIRERQLALQHETLPATASRPLRGRRILITTVLLIAVMGTLFVSWRVSRPPATTVGAPEAGGRVVQTAPSGEMDIVFLSPTGTFRSGRNTFTIEFRSSSGALVDVGAVRVSANMTMPGMVMPGNVQVQPSGVPGRYLATAEFGMAGAWPINVEWNGPAGSGSANFQGSVQ
jgi:Cu(I)/Ag(I) efflux system membrane protein CusA/SilA